MNIIDLLISKKNKIQDAPQKELEVSRLSGILGKKFCITIEALSADDFESVSKAENMRVAAVLKAVKDPNFKDENLRRAYTPQGRKNLLTPKELLETLLLPGEIANISSEVLALSGFSDSAVKHMEKTNDIEEALTDEAVKN